MHFSHLENQIIIGLARGRQRIEKFSGARVGLNRGGPVPGRHASHFGALSG